MEQRDAIVLTLGVDFFKMYPGGEKGFRTMLENMNNSDAFRFAQLCGTGVPQVTVPYCYLVFKGLVQYRCDVSEYIRRFTGEFFDGAIHRHMWKVNLVLMTGPVVTAPYKIPVQGFQGFRYSEFLF